VSDGARHAISTVCSGPRADRTSLRPTGCEVIVISDPTAAVVHPHAAGADRRRQRIKLLLGAMVDNREKVLVLITEAKESDDHIALGFKSWTDYVRTEYGGLLTRLTVEDRRETVLILSRTGLSTRAIAPILGTSDMTVRRDLASGATYVAPEVSPQGAADDDLDARLDNAPTEMSKITSTKPTNNVVGIDGKRYNRAPKPKPKPARRKPGQKATPDAFWDAAYDFQKKLTTLENVVKRASFPRNRKVIRDKHLGELIRYSNRLKVVISALTDPVDGDGPR